MVILMANPAFDRHYYNPGNWKLGFIYFCPSDKRLIVSKRIRALGWTLNFARPLAVPFVSFVGALVLAILDLIGSFGNASDFQMACELPLILGLIALCCWLAKPRHAG
ncbi:MAG: putative transrane protein of unknown function [Verrucomicrobiales bacterium]|nr:putative transrane protein of unknown function [Verrucomicrobiales bacterium]